MVTRCKAASVQSGKTQPTVALTQQPKTTKATDRLESNLRLDNPSKAEVGPSKGQGQTIMVSVLSYERFEGRTSIMC